MSERREGYVTHDNLWSNQAYDLHGDKTRIHVREVLPGDEEQDSGLRFAMDQAEASSKQLTELRAAIEPWVRDARSSVCGKKTLMIPLSEYRKIQALTKSEAGDE